MAKDRTNNPVKSHKKTTKEPPRKRGKDGKFLPKERGKPDKPAADLISEAEKVSAKLMRCRDKKLKATGAKLAVKIKAVRRGDPPERPPACLDPVILDAVGWQLTGDVKMYQDPEDVRIPFVIFKILKVLAKKHEISLNELFKIMVKTCPACTKLGPGLRD